MFRPIRSKPVSEPEEARMFRPIRSKPVSEPIHGASMGPDPRIVQQVVVDVQSTCRLCRVSLRTGKKGSLEKMRCLFGSKKDYSYTEEEKKKNKEPQLWRRFYAVGVFLVDRPGLSPRVCSACYSALLRAEKCWPTLKRWQEEHSDQAACRAQYQDHSDQAACHAQHPGPGQEDITQERRTTMGEGPPSKPPPIPIITPPEYLLPINRNGLPVAPLSEEGPPIDPFKPLKKNHPGPQDTLRDSNTEVLIQYPSKKVRLPCDPDVSGIIEHLAKGKWRTAAKQMLLHSYLVEELKPGFLQIVDAECRVLCDHKQGFVLRHSPRDQFRTFSFAALDGDLKRLAPFISSIFSTITLNRDPPTACAAAAIALRGRESRLSAFAYYVNNVLLFAGARRTAFKRLNRLGITTSHPCAVANKLDSRRKGYLRYLAGKTKTDELADGGAVVPPSVAATGGVAECVVTV